MDEMFGWHHRLNGHEFEETPGGSEGQGSLAWGCPWGLRELDTTEQQQNVGCIICFLDHLVQRSSYDLSPEWEAEHLSVLGEFLEKVGGIACK